MWPLGALPRMKPLSVVCECTEEARLEELLCGLECTDGRGLPMSLLNSWNTLSSPDCICRAIIGKLLRRSAKDLMFFFPGDVAENSLSSLVLDGILGLFGGCDSPLRPGGVAMLTLMVSSVPISGFEM